MPHTSPESGSAFSLRFSDLGVPVSAILSYGLALNEQSYKAAFLAGAVGLFYGVSLFLLHGKNQVTAAGLFGLGYAVFVAGASLYWLFDGVQPDLAFVQAQVITLVSMWSMDILFWRYQHYRKKSKRLNESTFYVVFIVAALALSALMLVMMVSNDTLIRRVAAGVVALLLILLILPRRGTKSSPARMVLAAAIFILFFEFFFKGFGRLVLVAIVLSVLVAVSGFLWKPWLKGLVIAAVVPSIMALASIRDSMESASGEELDGLGSVVNPFSTMVELANHIAQHGTPGIKWDSFVAVVLFWVPRSMWSDKPVGFGRELVLVLRPELATTNHSMAALFTAEWLYAFGVVGLLLMIVVLGIVVLGLDRLVEWSSAGDGASDGALPVYVLASAAFFAGQVPTMVWSGLFSPTSRSIQGLAGITMIMLISWMVISSFSGERSSHGRNKNESRKQTAREGAAE